MGPGSGGTEEDTRPCHPGGAAGVLSPCRVAQTLSALSRKHHKYCRCIGSGVTELPPHPAAPGKVRRGRFRHTPPRECPWARGCGGEGLRKAEPHYNIQGKTTTDFLPMESGREDKLPTLSSCPTSHSHPAHPRPSLVRSLERGNNNTNPQEEQPSFHGFGSEVNPKSPF